MRWVVHRISVLKKIRFQSMTRNEIQTKIRPENIYNWALNPEMIHRVDSGARGADATPRSTVALKDIAYVIEAEPLIFDKFSDNTPMKYVAMFNRRLNKGQCYIQPYFGCREFAVDFQAPAQDEIPISESRALGLMLYDIVFNKDGENRALFFNARLDNGIIIASPELVLSPAQQRELLSCSYKR